MSLWPCIVRELQVGARASGSYWLRVFCGAVAILVGICTLASEGGGIPSAVGAILFGNLSGALGASLGLLMPILLSDSISRERREGTLPLLLLTPLHPFEVVFAKSIAGVLRGLTIVLALLPLLAISFLLGGISTGDLLRAGLNQFSILFCSVAAGLVASSVTVDRRSGIFLALGIALLIVTISGPVQWLVLHRQWMPFEIQSWRDSGFLLLLPVIGWGTATGAFGMWNMRSSSTSVAMQLSGLLTVGSLLFLLAVVAFAGRQISRNQTVPPFGGSARVSRRRVRPGRAPTLSPARRPDPCLEVNPTGWLYTRRKSTRVLGRVWATLVAACLAFAILSENEPEHFRTMLSETSLSLVQLVGVLVISLIVLGVAAVAGRPKSFRRGWLMIGWLVATLLGWVTLVHHEGDALMGTSITLGLITLGGLVINSALSWREERETGALELLSVTTLSPAAILIGRWKALAAHYRWVFGLVFVGFWVGFLAEVQPWARQTVLGSDEFLWSFFLNAGALCSWAMVPLVGMYTSLKLRHALGALLATAVLGVLGPWLMLPILGAVIALAREMSPFAGEVLPNVAHWNDKTMLLVCGLTGLGLQLTAGLLAAFFCHRGMERRTLARA